MASQPQPEYRINLRWFRALYWPILLPVALLLALFNKLSPVPFKVYAIRVDRIGHLAANQEQFMMRMDLGMLPREFRVFIHRDHPSNGVLLEMLKRVLPINNLFLPLFDVCHKFGGLGVSTTELLNYSGRDQKQLVLKTKQHLSFTQEEIDEARQQCLDIGIDPNKPIIPVLGRDSTYLTSIKEPTDENSYRNVDINSYVPAMEYLADRYQVIRMGSVVKDPLRSSHPNVLDYSLSGRRTELLDVYLSAQCRFFISCGTGLDAITWCFRKPILYVHFIPPNYSPIFKPGCLFILKKYWHTVEKRYLTMSELLETGIGEKHTPRELDPLNIVIHDNTPEEILEAAKEMDDRLTGTWIETNEDKELQERFWAHFKKHANDCIIASRIGATYLRNNQFWLE